MKRRTFLSLLGLTACNDILEDMSRKRVLTDWFWMQSASAGVAPQPIVSGAAAIWSNTLMRTEYTGKAIRIKRASDSTETDISFRSTSLGAKISKTEIDSFTSNGSIAATVVTFYDQSGNGHNLTVEATRSPGELYYDSFYDNYYIYFGYSDTVVYQIPAGLSVNTRDCSLYNFVFGRKTSSGIEAYWDWGTNNLMYYQNEYNSRAIYDGAADIISAKDIKNTTDITIHSVRPNATNVKYNWDNLQSSTSPLLTSATPAGGRIGRWTGSASFFARYSFAGGIVYISALSDIDDTANVTAIQTHFGKTVNQSKLVVCLGDSITDGTAAASANSPAQRYPSILKREYTDSIRFVNSGITGNTLVQLNTDRAPRATDLIALGSYTNKVCIVWGGTNDIASGTSGATAHTSLQTLCNNLKTGGFNKIVVCDIIPRVDNTAGENTEKDTFNSLVAANYTSYADAFAQVSALAWNYGTHYGTDQIHPNPAGYVFALPTIKAALDSVL